ncbi:type IV secretory system conjugative DNA transfer family protein [Halococcus sp. IIIV-5B]|uniref:type IV secretory system conjugative DNA transfer family protein n=1 Tax=Halococcus sp. IIIV-5B TaxID=2321230 RepID=UPI000E737FB0|nr:type IV secretion system DNA-binding domain-containing protein [Halococcus sp. IIIV-5B]RJT07587.1 hypothetical protein D3261_03060 [Halococcus sp. IIIV-5B]
MSDMGDSGSYAGGAQTGSVESYSANDYAAAEIDAKNIERFQVPDEVEQAISVRPHKDNGGIEAMMDVLESLHTVESEGGGFLSSEQNVSPAHSFELRYTDDGTGERVLSLQYVPGSQSLGGTMERQLQNRYGDSIFDRTEPDFLPVEQAEDAPLYVSGAELALRKYTLFPIKNVDLPGFRNDPTGSIMQEMVASQDDAATDADVVVQIMFRPQDRDWRQGVSGGEGLTDDDDPNITGELSLQELSYNLNQPTLERKRKLLTKETIEYPPSKVDKSIANLLEQQQGEKGWHLCLRVFALSEDPDVARSRASKTAGMFENFYEANSEQTFVPQPIGKRDLLGEYADATARDFKETGIVKAQNEVAGLINIPEAEQITTSKMRWSLTKPGDGVPPGTPRFPFDDYDMAAASDEEKEIKIFDESSPGDPFYIGWGTKHGVEAGVYQRYLDAHMFVAGRTRYGKTTFVEHFFSQVAEREEGALLVDPKGKDADDFIREWPDDRDEEDLVVMDLGLNPNDEAYEKIPRFNFMEIPPGYDPDSRFAATMIEALADDLTAMVAQAGGSDNYMGALMKRVTKAVARGLLQSGRGITLLDLACACSSQAGLQEFANWMDEERIAFIRDTAERFAEKEDDDLEPLAGRMDEWIHNDAIRDLISARNPSFSVHEAVEDGKVVVVRFAEGSGESERRLLTTALIRRTYASKRVCDNADPFYLICDEFDKIVTEESNLHTILSEAGGHNYRCILACQAPGSQLPGRVKDAVSNQVDTFVSFNPGAENADYVARHHTVDAETLRHMARYKCYLKTHTSDDDITHSYLVDAFRPIREVRAEINDNPGMSDEEVEELKLRSMDRYGNPIESPSEQQAESEFYLDGTAGGGGQPGESGPSTLDMENPEVRNKALKAVYDESIRQGEPGGFVAVAEVLGRLRRYLPEGETINNVGQAWREVLQEVPDAYLDNREVEDEMEVRAADTGFMNLGMNENDGNAEHWAPMRDAYVPFTQLGFVMEIPDQTGDEMPDGLAKLDDALYLENVDDPAKIANRVNNYREDNPLLDRLAGTQDAYIESEHTTGSTQPSQTVRNLTQAHNDGHRCLFFARESVAEQVYDTVGKEPACCRSNHPEPNERRFYTGTTTLSINGEAMTRPGASENVWVQDTETGQYILRDTDGTIHATFDTPAEIFSDASAYPSGGDRNIKPPVIPEHKIGGDDPGAIQWDIIIVPEPEQDDEGNQRLLTPLDPKLYREDGRHVPVAELLGDESSSESEQPPQEAASTSEDRQDQQDQPEQPAASEATSAEAQDEENSDADESKEEVEDSGEDDDSSTRENLRRL